MQDCDFEAFVELMNSQFQRHGKPELGITALRISFAVLKDLEIEELTASLIRLAKQQKFMPSDAEILEDVEDDRDRNLAPCHRQFALPPRVETDEETKQAMQEALRRIRACASKVGKRMPTVDDPWEDAPWTDPRTPEQVAASRAEIAEQLASMTRRND